MGLPQIAITFVRKAATVIHRSSRGMVVILLDDDTKGQQSNPYTGMLQVAKEDWSEKNYQYLRLVFAAVPAKVLAVRMCKKEDTIDLQKTLELIKDVPFDYLTIPDIQPAGCETVKAYIRQLREDGKKAKAVLPGYAADYEGCINFATGDVQCVWGEGADPVVYTAAEYCARIAGVLASLPLTRSSTYYVLEEIVSASAAADPDAEIDAGKMILIYDGEKYKIARGVTSLTTASETAPADFKKIKIVEAADLIQYDIRKTFADTFVGRLVCSYANKQQFVGAVNQYLKDLEDVLVNKEEEHFVAISASDNLAYLQQAGKDTEELTEQQILEADTGSNLFLTGKVTLLDAMEDLQLTINL